MQIILSFIFYSILKLLRITRLSATKPSLSYQRSNRSGFWPTL